MKPIINQTSPQKPTKSVTEEKSPERIVQKEVQKEVQSKQKARKEVYVGIDWSRDKHQVNVYDENQRCLAKREVAHTHDGFQALHTQLQKIAGKTHECVIGIETSHNQLADFLFAHNYVVYIIPPSLVRASRGRQSNAGAKTDDRDASLLAEIVRTDRHRLVRWQPDSPTIQQLRVQIGVIDDLTQDILRSRNRLEHHLLAYFPAAVSAFSKLTTQSLLHCLQKWPSPTAMADVTFDTFAAFCHEHGNRRKKCLPACYARLTKPSPHTHPATIPAYAETTPLIAKRLLAAVEQKSAMLSQLEACAMTHASYEVFASLPGAGTLLVPKLMAIFGDRPERYPSPDRIRTLAGTCPTMAQSGKKRSVRFRHACNKSWRHTFQTFAKSSVSQSAWAAGYYEEAQQKGRSKNHAYRTLANRWVGIIWTLWNRNIPYDEAIHWKHVQRNRNNR